MRDETQTPEAPAAPQRKLTPANENPWYVLMTLYGEQEGEEIDEGLHEKNRRAWNSWVLRYLSIEEIEEQTVGWKSECLDDLIGLEWGRREEVLFSDEIQKRAVKSKYSLPGWADVVQFLDVEFNNELCLDGFVLPKDVEFTRCKLLGISAKYTAFLKDLRLEDVEVSQKASFSEALFCAAYRSFETEYLGPVNFLQSIFKSETFFYRDTFFSEAYFQDVKFCGEVEFAGSTFLYDGEGYYDEGLFQGCIFESPASFREVRFLRQYPRFHESLLHEKTMFSANNECWPDIVSQPLHHAKSACSAIRHLVAKQGLPEDEHFFFRREMQFASKIGSIWQRLPYLLFGWLSEYGYSIARPLWWLFAIWLFGTFVIAEHFVAETAEPLLGSDDWTAMALSFSNLFPVFGFGRAYFGTEFLQALPQHLKVLSGFQTVASLPLLFFLGLGLRQRFRLR